jgi:hypothetical protein
MFEREIQEIVRNNADALRSSFSYGQAAPLALPRCKVGCGNCRVKGQGARLVAPWLEPDS